MDTQHETLLRDGYVIIESAVSEEALNNLRCEAGPRLRKVGRNSFEG